MGVELVNHFGSITECAKAVALLDIENLLGNF